MYASVICPLGSHEGTKKKEATKIMFLSLRAFLHCLRGFVWKILNDPAAHLVELDALEQGFEIALAEAFVALALDDLEEDRADHILGENLQQQALAVGRGAVDEDAALFELGGRLAMVLHPFVDQLVIGVGRVLEGDAARAQDVDRLVDVVGAELGMLDSLPLKFAAGVPAL